MTDKKTRQLEDVQKVVKNKGSSDRTIFINGAEVPVLKGASVTLPSGTATALARDDPETWEVV